MLSGSNSRPKGTLLARIPTYVGLFTNISFFCLVVQCKNMMILGNSIQQDFTLHNLKVSRTRGRDRLIITIPSKRSLWCFMCWISKPSIGQIGGKKTFQAMMILLVISALNLAIYSFSEVSRTVESAINFFTSTFKIKIMRHCQKTVQTRSLMMSDHVRDLELEWCLMKKRSNSTFLEVWKMIISHLMTCGSSISQKRFGPKSISVDRSLNREPVIQWIYTKAVSLCLEASSK